MSVVSYCTFIGFSKNGNGSVIESNGINITFKCTKFTKNYASNFGGSIFLENSQLFLIKSSFLKCSTPQQENNIGGNAVCHYGPEAIISDVSISECGPIGNPSGDSSFRSTYSKVQLKLLNSSSNQGSTGSSAFSFNSCLSGSNGSFLNVYDVRDEFAIEVSADQGLVPISLSNFVKFNPDLNSNVIWMRKEGLFEFKSCCFYETNGVSFSASDRKCTLTDCVSDSSEITSPTITSLTLFPINFDFSCEIMRTCFQKRLLTQRHIAFYFLFIVLK